MTLRNPSDQREPVIGDVFKLLLGAHVRQFTEIGLEGDSLSVNRSLTFGVRRYVEFAELVTSEPK